MSKHNYVEINYKEYRDSKYSKDEDVLYINLSNDNKKTLTIYNDKIKKLILYHYNVKSIMDLSNFPNLKYVYMFACYSDKLEGIDNLEELILSSCVFKKIQYTPTLKLFYQHAHQSGYESFITSYHQLKSDLSNTTYVNWDKVYLEYINAIDHNYISKI